MRRNKKADQGESEYSRWHVRREVTVGAAAHLAAIVMVLAAGWSNLQKELALIRHDLNQLMESNKQVNSELLRLADRQRLQEYRLEALEKQKQKHDGRYKDETDKKDGDDDVGISGGEFVGGEFDGGVRCLAAGPR